MPLGGRLEEAILKERVIMAARLILVMCKNNHVVML